MPADELDDRGITEGDVDEIDPRDGKEVITTWDLPPIFVSGNDASDLPTTRRIEVVFVSRKNAAKELAYIDWKPIEQLEDISQLLDIFGPGTYRVQGRASDRKTVVKQIFHTVGAETQEVLSHRERAALERSARAPQLDLTQIVAAVTAIATPVLGVLGTLMDRRDAARREERERDEKRAEMFMTTMTQLMNARNSDLEHMLKASQRPSSANTPAEAYQEGQAATLELIQAIKDQGLAGEDSESKLISLVEAFMTGKTKADAEAVAAAQAAQAAANGAS